jgi:hypothetical protein
LKIKELEDKQTNKPQQKKKQFSNFTLFNIISAHDQKEKGKNT